MATTTGLLGSTSTTSSTATKAPTDYSTQLSTWYKNALGRDPDAAGAAYWQDRLNTGSSMTQVQKEIGDSEEAKALRASNAAASQPATAPAATATSTATGYTPTDVQVTPESTVAGQLASITANGSPLITQAETQALKDGGKRGLLNSSITTGAAREAVYKTALPVAQQDAQTNANAATTNATQKTGASQFLAGAQNSNSQFNAGQTNSMQQTMIQADLQTKLQQIQSNTTLSVADKQIASQKAQADADRAAAALNTDKTLASQQTISERDNATKLQLQTIDADVKKSLAQMDEATKVKLQSLDATDKQLLQTNISAANAYAQLAQALSNISTSTTMDAAAKQQASDNQINTFRATLQALGQVSGLDLSKYFQQVSTSAQGGATAAANSNASNAQQAASDVAGMM